MKKAGIIFLGFLILQFGVVGYAINDNLRSVNARSSAKYNKLIHDFDTIIQGEIAEFTFTYVNESSIPLTLKDVAASCGCTTADWNRAPLMKGKKGRIKASFNSRGREDEFEKDIYVFSNQGLDTLTIKGTIVVPIKEN